MTPIGSIVQVAYAVDDVERAAHRWATTVGAGPFFVRHHPSMTGSTANGGVATLDHSSAYGQWGAVQIELVHVRQVEPSSVAAVMASRGVHHVARFVSSLDEEGDRLSRLGWPLLVTFTTGGGLRFAFHDTRADLGHLLELYEPTPELRDLYARIKAAAAGWTGDRPVREL